MKRMVLLLTLVWLGLFGMGTVAQAMEVTKFPISTIKNKIEASPDIYGDIVVWQGEGDGNYLNIYGKNLGTGKNMANIIILEKQKMVVNFVLSQ